MNPRSFKSVLLKLAALCIGVALSLVVIDFAIRLIPEKKSPRVKLPLFRTSGMPFNSLRYQDFEYPQPKGLNVFRIITVGDSFTEGGYTSFENSYPKKLEYYLNHFGNNKGTNYQVINMSRGGRSTIQEVGLIKHHAGELKPDLVILGYCLNDPEDWVQGSVYLQKLREKCCYHQFIKPEGWESFFYNHSALVRLVTQRIFNSRVKAGHIKYFHKLYRDSYPGWQEAKASLRELADLSRTSHIPVRVVIFPLFPYGLGENYPFSDIHEKLHSVFEEAGLRYIDLFPVFKDMDHTSLEYIPYKDPHPSEFADRIAAETLWQDLMREGLTPEGKKPDADVISPKAPPKW
ncbi:MAG: SGNH/GDSL hydrolase family protein [Candidatus Aureabacteria bacterium]|nr:SGNH/GDSL hydrolase family protein [Candidatus Auribacterota bacterium]